MGALFQGPGFLGTKATFGSDTSLVLILLAAALFTIGWRLAVRKHYGPHRWVQTAAACLNAVPVLGLMIRSFLVYILPGIPSKLGEATYAFTTVHALIGVTGLTLGVFVALRGNELVPKGLRFTNYKLFMRTSYALYMLATLVGVILYVVVFTGGSS
jgi:uncharacterized membrane protein YozB (DUF420 family)